jgi:hypothetical protein
MTNRFCARIRVPRHDTASGPSCRTSAPIQTESTSFGRCRATASAVAIADATTLAGFGNCYNTAGLVGGILLAMIGFLIGAFVAGGALTLWQCAESLDRLVEIAELRGKQGRQG